MRIENAKDKDVAVQTKQAVSLAMPKGSIDVYKKNLKYRIKNKKRLLKRCNN
ncbi:hypothetical protein AAHH71_29305 [Bacillus toyonensis]